MSVIDWRFVSLLSSLGILMGVLTLFGLLAFWVEMALWFLIALAWVGSIYWKTPPRPFWHGFFIALFGVLDATFIQIAFAPLYLENNPGLSAGYQSANNAFPGPIQVVMLAAGTAFALLIALVCGFAARFSVTPEEA